MFTKQTSRIKPSAARLESVATVRTTPHAAHAAHGLAAEATKKGGAL